MDKEQKEPQKAIKKLTDTIAEKQQRIQKLEKRIHNQRCALRRTWEINFEQLKHKPTNQRTALMDIIYRQNHKIKEKQQKLNKIAQIIEDVDDRCAATDGAITPTLEEMTQEEISEIYRLSKGLLNENI